MRKTYYPTKIFDDQLDALVKLYKSKGWTFSGVDLLALDKDSQTQRSERAVHDEVERSYLHTHETFGVSQEERHRRFSTAVRAARAAFKHDKGVMAELEQFKRPTTRRPKKPG